MFSCLSICNFEPGILLVCNYFLSPSLLLFVFPLLLPLPFSPSSYVIYRDDYRGITTDPQPLPLLVDSHTSPKKSKLMDQGRVKRERKREEEREEGKEEEKEEEREELDPESRDHQSQRGVNKS